METAEILEKARAGGEPPHGWIVLPLLRNKVATGIVGWIFGVIVGFGLFALIAPAMVPHNYQNGAIEALFSTIILGMTLFIGVGSVWQIIVDTRRLLQADEHFIIITPEDFVMQDGTHIIHVPLMYVRYVTARGTPPPDRTTSGEAAVRDIPRSGESIFGFLFGRGMTPSGRRQRRKRKHGPTMLAFVDCRTDTEVKVANDASYGDPFAIAATLEEYAASVQRIT